MQGLLITQPNSRQHVGSEGAQFENSCLRKLLATHDKGQDDEGSLNGERLLTISPENEDDDRLCCSHEEEKVATHILQGLGCVYQIAVIC